MNSDLWAVIYKPHAYMPWPLLADFFSRQPSWLGLASVVKQNWLVFQSLMEELWVRQ